MHPTVPTTRLLPQQIRVINARHAVNPANGNAAASSQPRCAGFGVT